MKPKHLLFLSSLVGIICGVLSARVLSIGWFNLAFWGIVAIGIGLRASEKKTVIWSGVLYGFFLSISFLFSGFQGAPDKFFGFALFSLFLSAIGAVGGLVCVLIGSKLRK